MYHIVKNSLYFKYAISLIDKSFVFTDSDKKSKNFDTERLAGIFAENIGLKNYTIQKEKIR